MRVSVRVGGFSLLETVTASFLLAVLVVGIVPALVELATRLPREAAGAETPAESTPSGVWGMSPGYGGWSSSAEPGELHLMWRPPPGDQDTAVWVGLWVDGWLLDEIPSVGTSGQGAVELGGPALWCSHPGAEVVVRCRMDKGPWGPPRRLVVPFSSASTPDLTATGYEQVVTVHPAYFGEKEMLVSADGWETVRRGTGVIGTVLSAASEAGISLDGHVQSWRADGPRTLDVYF
ncbi:MAG: hypothetical protein Kow00129_11430 [Thermoleophilia bacterium]